MSKFIFECTGELFAIKGVMGFILAGTTIKNQTRLEEGDKVLIVRQGIIKRIAKVRSVERYVTGDGVNGIVLDDDDDAKFIEPGDRIELWKPD